MTGEYILNKSHIRKIIIGLAMITPWIVHPTYATNVNAMLVAVSPEEMDDSDVDPDNTTVIQDNMGLGTAGSENGSVAASAGASASASASM